MRDNPTLKHKFVSKMSDSETKRNDILAEIENFLERKEKYLEERKKWKKQKGMLAFQKQK